MGATENNSFWSSLCPPLFICSTNWLDSKAGKSIEAWWTLFCWKSRRIGKLCTRKGRQHKESRATRVITRFVLILRNSYCCRIIDSKCYDRSGKNKWNFVRGFGLIFILNIQYVQYDVSWELRCYFLFPSFSFGREWMTWCDIRLLAIIAHSHRYEAYELCGEIGEQFWTKTCWLYKSILVLVVR